MANLHKFIYCGILFMKNLASRRSISYSKKIHKDIRDKTYVAFVSYVFMYLLGIWRCAPLGDMELCVSLDVAKLNFPF